MEENDLELQKSWGELLKSLEPTFGGGLDLDTMIFLVGVQELGQGYRKFKKQEKMELMHVAICRLLSQYGYYEYEGMDKDGWPHWKSVSQMPSLSPKAQSKLMKEAIIEYFQNAELIN